MVILIGVAKDIQLYDSAKEIKLSDRTLPCYLKGPHSIYRPGLILVGRILMRYVPLTSGGSRQVVRSPVFCKGISYICCNSIIKRVIVTFHFVENKTPLFLVRLI